MERFATSLFGEASTLLLATDGSHYSDGAVQEAIFFGQACSAKVIALHVLRIDSESLKSAESALRTRRQEIAPYMQQLRDMAQDSGVEMEIVVLGAGHPEQAIAQQAYQRKADVILMGRHGKSGRLSHVIGRMTSRVLNLGFPRVLVVPKDFIISGARVLLATDDSPGAAKAALDAISLGHRSSTLQHLTVMSVVKRDTDVAERQQVVEALCQQVKQSGPQVVCEPLVQVGNPAKLIISAARQRQTDMILIGGPGKRGLTRVLHGHVTRNVTGKAHCAVLVVNA